MKLQSLQNSSRGRQQWNLQKTMVPQLQQFSNVFINNSFPQKDWKQTGKRRKRERKKQNRK